LEKRPDGGSSPGTSSFPIRRKKSWEISSRVFDPLAFEFREPLFHQREAFFDFRELVIDQSCDEGLKARRPR
jgi:hypothetical protein